MPYYKMRKTLAFASLLVPQALAAQTAKPPVKSTLEIWTERLTAPKPAPRFGYGQVRQTDTLDYSARQDFAKLDAETQFLILQADWLKIPGEETRRELLTTALTGNDETGIVRLKNTPRLLEILDLGANDTSDAVQQAAFAQAGNLAMQRFEDKEAYFAWRSAIGTKSLEDITRDSAAAFAAQFKAADDSEKMERFPSLLALNYYTSYTAKTADGQTTRTLTAEGTEKIRRDALLQAGLLDTMADILHSNKSPDLTQDAMAFLDNLVPDDAYLQRIEPDVRRIFETRLAQGKAVQGDSPQAQGGTLNLLFAYRSAWVLPLLAHWTQRDYLTFGRDGLRNVLIHSSDARAIPLLIALGETASPTENGESLAALSSLTGVTANAPADMGWWRGWWEKNKSKYPAEIRDTTVPGLKTGTAALTARVLNGSEQTGFDYRATGQLAELDPKSQYAALQELWARDLPDNAKANLLRGMRQWRYGGGSALDNPYLLEELNLGMMDEGPQTQQIAADLLFSLTMQSFSDTDDYVAWHKKNAAKPLVELVRDGVTSFTARFKQADEAQKIELLLKAQQIPFQSGISIKTADGKQVETVEATGLTGERRKAALAAGLPDTAAALAQSANPAAVQTAANFLAAFHAGPAYTDRIEDSVRRAYAKMLAKPDENPNLMYYLLVSYHSPWVGEAMTQIVEKNYIEGSRTALNGLLYSNDRRAVPLLISLIDSVGQGEKQQILRQLSNQLRVPFDAAHDSAWWRDWWKKNLSKQPQEAQAVPLLELKKGDEILAARLTQNKENDWETLQMLNALDENTLYALLRDNWKKITAETMRVNIIENLNNDNTWLGDNSRTGSAQKHLLDILALGAGDTSATVRSDALGFAANIAGRPFTDAKDFAAWRSAAGDRPLPDLVREGTQALIAKMAAADAKTLPVLIEQATMRRWYSFESENYDQAAEVSTMKVTAIGLTAVRRKTALDSHFLEKLAGWLKPNQPDATAMKALELTIQFMPGRAFMRQIEDDVKRLVSLRKINPKQYDFTLGQVLHCYNSPWATDALLRLANSQYASHSEDIIMLLAGSRDLRVAPYLISALAETDDQSWQRQEINLALTHLTHRTPGTALDADGWRNWWKKNRDSLPETARNESFPNFQIQKTAKEYSIRRGKKQMTIGGDPKRAYWLVASGLLLKRQPNLKPSVTPAAVPSPNDFSAIPAAERPGLIVVLAEGDAEGAAAKYWQEVAGKGFGGKYLIALAVAPKWRENQIPRWLTKEERGGIKEAAFTTEAFAAQIVKDVESKFPVNPARVLLAGANAGGQAAYACSLEPQTPFKGFALLDAPFHPALLPPMTNAKGRRYILLHNAQDKQAPYFLAKAALQTLQKAGAFARLNPAAAAPDTPQKVPRESVTEGIKWLEAK